MADQSDLRVLICEPLADAGVAYLKERFQVDDGVGWSKAELLERVAPYDAVVVRSATKVTAEFIDKAVNLKVVGRAGTGVDNVDVPAATRRGIIVCNAAGSNSLSAAEHTIALIMAQARNVAPAHAALVDGRWERSKYGGIEVDGKTLGILGFGRIGQLVAERARGLGMHVVAYDPFVADARYREMGVDKAETPDDVYAAADFITLHLASTPETKGFVNTDAFAKMKPGARLINVGRGDLVDTAALVDALTNGTLGGAGVDVFPEEPCTDSPLFGLANVVVTPHLGASTAEAQDRAGVVVAEQVAAALTGGVVTSAVNIPAVGPEALATLGPFLPAAQHLGALLTALAGGVDDTISVEYAGEIVEQDTRLLTATVAVGALAGHVDQPVNVVNAMSLAEERGIRFDVRTSAESPAYRSVITLSTGDVSVGGSTVGVTARPRLVSAFGHPLEIEMAPHMAFFRNKDVPGMIGKVGTVLGDEGVNVASMAVSPGDGDLAVIAITVSDEVPDDAQQRIRAIEGFQQAWFVNLPMANGNGGAA
ncbi:MAG: phosphoglycerate dehydrogenase [Thermoleophilia bacterium]|nr:phosphoglycerate dehydrogenase [Thermoleophilia bacterium]